MRERLETDIEGHFTNATIRIKQEGLGFFDAHPRQIIRERQTGGALEQFAKIKRARVDSLRYGGQTNRVVLILRYELFGTRNRRRLELMFQ